MPTDLSLPPAQPIDMSIDEHLSSVPAPWPPSADPLSTVASLPHPLPLPSSHSHSLQFTPAQEVCMLGGHSGGVGIGGGGASGGVASLGQLELSLKPNMHSQLSLHSLSFMDTSHASNPVIVRGGYENGGIPSSSNGLNGCASSSSSDGSHSCSPVGELPGGGVNGGVANGSNTHSNNNADASSAIASLINQHMKTEPLDAGYLSAAHLNGMGMHNMISSLYASPSTVAQSSYGSRPESTAQSGSSGGSRRSRAGDGMLKCQFCPKKWPDETQLHSHMAECRMVRMHECQQCGKRFKARGGLQQHMRIHSNERPYQCHFCTKRFTQKSHVDQHERIHTGAKPFVCQFCGRAFRQRSQQIGHEATHANQHSSASSSHHNHSSAASHPQQQQPQPPSHVSHPAPHEALTGGGDPLLLGVGQCNQAVSSLLALSSMPGHFPPQSGQQSLGLLLP